MRKPGFFFFFRLDVRSSLKVDLMCVECEKMDTFSFTESTSDFVRTFPKISSELMALSVEKALWFLSFLIGSIERSLMVIWMSLLWLKLEDLMLFLSLICVFYF